MLAKRWEGIPTAMGKAVWTLTSVRNILTNETYRGSKLMQKTFVTNYLTKSKKANEGELPSYFIEKSHEPIIPPDEWDAVQVEINRRRQLGSKFSSKSPFSSKIICGDCGAFFGSKVWQSNTKYRQIIWRCNDRYNKRGKRDCKTSHVKEDLIKDKFLIAFNELVSCRDELIGDCKMIQKMLCDTTAIEIEIQKLEHEIEETEGLVLKAIVENSRQVINQAEWMERNGTHINRHSAATKQLAELDKKKSEMLTRSKVIGIFIKNIEVRKAITDWDEELWADMVESVTVGIDGKLNFKFKNGSEIKAVS